jgi:tetratricopeptide (TPR) repeat protein
MGDQQSTSGSSKGNSESLTPDVYLKWSDAHATKVTKERTMKNRMARVRLTVLAAIGGATFLGLVVAGNLRAQPPQRGASKPNYWLQAAQLEKQGNYAEAAALYERAANEKSPPEVQWLSQAGWCYVDSRQFTEAKRVFAGCLEQVPNFGNAIDGLWVARFAENDWTGIKALIDRWISFEERGNTESVLQAGMRSAERSKERDLALGYLYTRAGSGNLRGIAPLERVLGSEAGNAEALWRLASLYSAAQRTDDAARVCKEFLNRYPDAPESFILRAGTIRSPKAALDELEKGLAKHPQSTRLAAEAARLCDRLTGVAAITRAEALASTLRKAKNTRGEVLFRSTLARRYIEARHYPDAEPLLRAAARPNGSAVPWEKLAQVELALGKYEKASESYAQAASIRERDPLSAPAQAVAARGWRVLALLASGKKAEAADLANGVHFSSGERSRYPIADFETMKFWMRFNRKTDRPAYVPGDEKSLLIEWKYLQAANPTQPVLVEDARQAVLREIARRYPDCYPAHVALARSLAVSGEKDLAVRTLQTAREVKPQWWVSRWTLGHYYVLVGQPEDAKKELTAAHNLAPGLAEAGHSIELAFSRPQAVSIPPATAGCCP